ncbi:MAG: hypothetical protein Q4G68_11770 [Planctomycetia bacterium]|nr:hypothetical protein [Planctomycetia bacterium]
MREKTILRQRGTLVFLALFAIAGVVSLVCWLQAEVKPEQAETMVFSGWQYGREDQKMAAKALAKAGLSDYRWENGCLYVPQTGKMEYESVLAAAEAFPKAPSDIKRDSIREMGPFESVAKTQLRDLNSSAWQLEQTIEQFSTQVGYATVGVRSRRVQDGMMPKTIVTASVGVWTRENESLSPELISAITLAAKHQLGIDEDDNISILDLRHGCSYLGTDTGVSEPGKLAESQRRKEEEYWQEKFTSALNYIPGVRVSTVYRPVALAQAEPMVPKSPDSPETRPRPSSLAVLGNAPPRTVVTGYPAAPDYPSYAARFAEDRSGSPALPPRPTESYASSANPCPLSVDIAIPASYVTKLVQTRTGATPVSSAEQVAVAGENFVQEIRKQAASLLTPFFQGQSNSWEELPADCVHVSLYTDAAHTVTQPASTEPASTEPPAARQHVPDEHGLSSWWTTSSHKIALLWSQHRNILQPTSYAVGAILLLTTLGVALRRHRRIRRPRQKEEETLDLETDQITDDFTRSAPSEIRQEIQDLVHNDPEQAARLIQKWVHSG